MPMNPRLMRPIAAKIVGGFDPATISGLVAYWDAQVPSSYDTVTGVSEWRDLSGNGHTLTQAITNNQPALSFINGKRAFQFDGSNDSLSAASSVYSFSSDDDFTFFGVTNASNSESGYLFTNGSIGEGGLGIYMNTTVYSMFYNIGASGALSSPTKADSVAQVWSLTHAGAAGVGLKTGVWRLDGVGASDVTSSTASPSASQNLVVGNRNGGTASATYFAGLVGSLLVYNRILTNQEIGIIEQWLGSRWGVTVA